MAQKFYAIKVGKQTGVFTGNWKQIEAKYIKGYPHAEYRGFKTKEEAEKYLKQPSKIQLKMKNAEEKLKQDQNKQTKQKQEKKRLEKNQKKEKVVNEQVESERRTNLRRVMVVVTGHSLYQVQDRPGYYDCLLIDEKSGGYRFLPKPNCVPGMTPNQAIIQGVIDATLQLKEPCHISVYSKTPFGEKLMKRNNKGINHDYLEKLCTVVVENGHEIENIVDIAKVNELMNHHRRSITEQNTSNEPKKLSKAEERGREDGAKEAVLKMAKSLLESGLSIGEVAKHTPYDPDLLEKLLKEKEHLLD